MSDHEGSTLLSVSPISEHPKRGFSSPFNLDPYTERFRLLQSLVARKITPTVVGEKLHTRFRRSGLANVDIKVTDEVALAMENFVVAMREHLALSGYPIRGDWLKEVLTLSQECSLQRSWLTDKHWVLYELFRLVSDPLPGYVESSRTRYLSEAYSMLSRAFESSEFSERETKKYLRRLRSVTFNPGYIEKLNLFRDSTVLEEIREKLERTELKLLVLSMWEED